MERQIEALAKIQGVDSKIKEILKKKEAFPKKIAELSAELSSAKSELDELKTALEEHLKERRQLQSQVELNKERIERVEEKLPLIKTNKEYQALNKEIENMRKEIVRDEDRLLSILEDDETLQSQINEKEGIFKEVEADITGKVNKYQTEMSKFDQEITHFDIEKKKLSEGIEKKNLAKYEKIRSRRDGVAIIEAITEVCQGCFMNLPPQLFIRIQKSDEIITCPNCNRILYFKGVE